MLRHVSRDWKDSHTQKSQKQYFKEHLNYHEEGGSSQGKWVGKGAELLGLVGAVTEEQYDALAMNRHPVTREKLKVRDIKHPRLNEELVIAPPKSVSITWALLKDDSIKQAHCKAVETMLKYMELEVQARKRAGLKKNSFANEDTENLLSSVFNHDTARAVGNHKEDMFLHSHILLWNYTRNYDGIWKAAEFGNVISSLSYYEAIYHSTLAEHLQQLGYEIQRKGKKWEIKGFSKALIEKFSKRSTQVKNAEMKLQQAKGRLLSDKERDKLGEFTRGKKIKTKEVLLMESWNAQLSSKDRKQLKKIKENRLKQFVKNQNDKVSQQYYLKQSVAAQQSLNYAIESNFERNSVVKKGRFMADAIINGIGKTTVKQIEIASIENQKLKFGKDYKGVAEVTTIEVIKEELKILSEFQKGLNILHPIVKDATQYQFKHEFLQKECKENQGQRAAVKHVLSSRDRFTLVKGRAGVGKTTSCQELRELLGKDFMAFAPTTNAVDVLVKDGFKNVNTTQILEKSTHLQEEAKGKVWLIDEAGLLGGKSMLKIAQLAEKCNSRVILMGDETQHESVVRGNPFRMVSKYMKDSVSIAEINHIWRQKGDYKIAVEAITQGKIKGSLDQLKRLEWIHQEGDNIYKEVAKKYANLSEKGMTVAATAPIHKEKNQISFAIRQELKDRKLLDNKDKSLFVYKSKNWTIAERKDTSNYERGHIIQFIQNSKGIDGIKQGFVKSSRHEVISIDHKGIFIKDLKTQKKAVLPISEAIKFNVYGKEKMAVAKGEMIKINFNSKKDGVYNGQILKVKAFHSKELEFENGIRLPKDFGFLDYAYTRTSHSIQGSTLNYIIPVISGDSHQAAGLKQWYVDVSRGNKGCHVYTDDVEKLEESISRDQNQKAAIEMKVETKQTMNNNSLVTLNSNHTLRNVKPRL
ncbi:MAG: hypothetical protein CMO01_27160 [Thalassobius sp.]|nr:hypothetical protein [Thalassovita sp.]